MKARITFYIGLSVLILSIVQMLVHFEPVRFVGIGIGILFILWGWKIGWASYRNLTVIVGHIAIVAGCMATVYGLCRIPFLETAPGWLEILDLPLFWGLFTIWGGNCMITHGYCSCAMSMHKNNNQSKKG